MDSAAPAPVRSASTRQLPPKKLKLGLNSGTTWLVVNGAFLVALSICGMGIFTNLWKTVLHPKLPLATSKTGSLMSDFITPPLSYGFEGWAGELMAMGVGMIGSAFSFRYDSKGSRKISKWGGRSYVACLLRSWIKPFSDPKTIWKREWLIFFWVAFGVMWIWAEMLFSPSKVAAKRNAKRAKAKAK